MTENPAGGRITIDLPADHPVFAGHFPGHPIVPGALILDEVVQAVSRMRPGCGWQLASTKFFRPATPGETLVIELDAATATGAVAFRVLAAEHLIASGSMQARERAP